MRTYYRGPDALITTELFVRRVTSTKSYAIRDLRNVCIASDQGSAGRRPLVATGAGLLGLIGTVGTLVADRPNALILVGPATVLAVAGTLLWPRPAVHWELRASYRGRPISLYSSSDVTVFNQVSRGLRRALEAEHRPPRYEEDDAA